jgi:hypothetical protein
MTFHFGSDGLIDTLSVKDRGRAIGDRIVPTPWEGRMADYRRRDAMLIPLQAEVAWLTPEGRRPHWRGTVTQIGFRR